MDQGQKNVSLMVNLKYIMGGSPMMGIRLTIVFFINKIYSQRDAITFISDLCNFQNKVDIIVDLSGVYDG